MAQGPCSFCNGHCALFYVHGFDRSCIVPGKLGFCAITVIFCFVLEPARPGHRTAVTSVLHCRKHHFFVFCKFFLSHNYLSISNYFPYLPMSYTTESDMGSRVLKQEPYHKTNGFTPDIGLQNQGRTEFQYPKTGLCQYRMHIRFDRPNQKA